MKDPLFRRLAAAAWALLALIAAVAGPGTRAWPWVEAVPLCLFKALTGVPCPGCGMIHSLVDAFRGDWSSSFAHHPLGLPLLAVWTLWLFAPRALKPLRRPAASLAALALVLGAYALRLAA